MCSDPNISFNQHFIIIIIISAVHATAGRWPPQLGCGVEPRNPPRWFRAAWWARQLSLRVDSLAMRQVVWGYILPIAGPKQNLWPDLTNQHLSKLYILPGHCEIIMLTLHQLIKLCTHHLKLDEVAHRISQYENKITNEMIVLPQCVSKRTADEDDYCICDYMTHSFIGKFVQICFCSVLYTGKIWCTFMYVLCVHI